MDKDSAKKYYKKISTTFNNVNKQDEFAKKFLDYLKSADTKVYQKERKERRIFDDSWVKPVDDIIPVIDKLTRNPREILKKYQYVVAVERAKKIDSESIRHLAANTHLIKDTKLDGTVVPKKILTSYSDSSFGTYENRFLKSLVDKLYRFIEMRYDLIVKKMNSEYINHLEVNSGFEIEDTQVFYDINFRVHRNIADDDLGKKNRELFKKMTGLRSAIGIYKLSSFMKEMEQFPPVKAPIQKTNIILKDIDFQKCYELWNLLDAVDFIGYDVDFFERNVKFDDEYLSQIENSILVLYATIANKQIEDFMFARDKPLNYKKRKALKTSTNTNDEYLEPEIVRFQDNRINQYYLDQIRQVTQARYDNILSSGISRKETINILYNQLIKIADDVLKDFVINNFKVEETATIEEQLENQRQVVKIYREIEKLKRENLKEFSTEKAIAILNLQNLNDKYKQQIEEEKARIQAEEEDERQRRLEEGKQKALNRLAKRRKIERAQKVLDEAEKRRQNPDYVQGSDDEKQDSDDTSVLKDDKKNADSDKSVEDFVKKLNEQKTEAKEVPKSADEKQNFDDTPVLKNDEKKADSDKSVEEFLKELNEKKTEAKEVPKVEESESIQDFETAEKVKSELKVKEPPKESDPTENKLSEEDTRMSASVDRDSIEKPENNEEDKEESLREEPVVVEEDLKPDLNEKTNDSEIKEEKTVDEVAALKRDDIETKKEPEDVNISEDKNEEDVAEDEKIVKFKKPTPQDNGYTPINPYYKQPSRPKGRDNGFDDPAKGPKGSYRSYIQYKDQLTKENPDAGRGGHKKPNQGPIDHRNNPQYQGQSDTQTTPKPNQDIEKTSDEKENDENSVESFLKGKI